MMLIILAVVLVLGGIILQYNPHMFHGAVEVGHAALWIGIAMWVFIIIVMISSFVLARDFSKW